MNLSPLEEIFMLVCFSGNLLHKVSLMVRAISELKIPRKKKNLKMSIILIHGPESGFESRFIKIFLSMSCH